jgi:hypothetical protein
MINRPPAGVNLFRFWIRFRQVNDHLLAYCFPATLRNQ